MTNQLNEIASALRSAPDPVAKGRSILLDEYRKTEGVLDLRVGVMARYELVKSMVVQSAYEMMGGTGGLWLEAGRLDEEMRDAERMSALYREQASALYAAEDPGRRVRSLIAHPSSDPERFCGSSRLFVPGVGYGASVRKRDTMNQDSFLIEDGPPLLAVADGCSGSMFSAAASLEAVSRLAALKRQASLDPVGTICGISGHIAGMLNDAAVMEILKAGGGYTTLTLALPGAVRTRFYKVGDSMPFLGVDCAGRKAVECVSNVDGLHNVLGTELDGAMVEGYVKSPGTAVLTSDGVTNYLEGYIGKIRKALDATGDAVIAAETILRAVLRKNMDVEFSDDTTIVIGDDDP